MGNLVGGSTVMGGAGSGGVGVGYSPITAAGQVGQTAVGIGRLPELAGPLGQMAIGGSSVPMTAAGAGGSSGGLFSDLFSKVGLQDVQPGELLTAGGRMGLARAAATQGIDRLLGGSLTSMLQNLGLPQGMVAADIWRGSQFLPRQRKRTP